MQFTADDVKVHSIHQKWIRQLLSSNTVLPMLSSCQLYHHPGLLLHKKFIEKASSMHFFPLLCTTLYYSCLPLALHSQLLLRIGYRRIYNTYYNRKYSLGSNAKRAKQENPLQKALLLIFQNLGKQQEALLLKQKIACLLIFNAL